MLDEEVTEEAGALGKRAGVPRVNRLLKTELQRLRRDYTAVVGQPFVHFFCPIVFKDEETELCRAHVVNRKFKSRPYVWTVQRSDVDGFYGSLFESHFTLMRHKGRTSAFDAVTDKKLRRALAPRLYVGGNQVDCFFPSGPPSGKLAAVELRSGQRLVTAVTKVRIGSGSARLVENATVSFSKDLRLAALASLIKAAHLTLFKMLGYGYALAAGGEFVGRQILGRFFTENRGKPRDRVVENGRNFFNEFRHMVRPVLACSARFRGSIADARFLVCRGGDGLPWGLIVFVATRDALHGVVVPALAETLPVFLDFLERQPATMRCNVCSLERPSKTWVVDPGWLEITWPRVGTLHAG